MSCRAIPARLPAGASGSDQKVETLLAATIQAGLDTGAVRPESLERISVDTTVQPKAITHPTDAKLYLKALQALVRQAKRHGLRCGRPTPAWPNGQPCRWAAMPMPARCDGCGAS